LFGADFAAFDGLQPEFTKIQFVPAICETSHFSFLLFAKFYFFRAKHNTHSCCEARDACSKNQLDDNHREPGNP
jgi:hypothetical protein